MELYDLRRKSGHYEVRDTILWQVRHGAKDRTEEGFFHSIKHHNQLIVENSWDETKVASGIA